MNAATDHAPAQAAQPKQLFCDWVRMQAELRSTYHASYAAGRAKLTGDCPRAAVLEVL